MMDGNDGKERQTEDIVLWAPVLEGERPSGIGTFKGGAGGVDGQGEGSKKDKWVHETRSGITSVVVGKNKTNIKQEITSGRREPARQRSSAWAGERTTAARLRGRKNNDHTSHGNRRAHPERPRKITTKHFDYCTPRFAATSYNSFRRNTSISQPRRGINFLTFIACAHVRHSIIGINARNTTTKYPSR